MGRKKLNNKTETARVVTFEGGPCDEQELRVAVPLAERIMLDMGRAPYYRKGPGLSVYVYDPDRKYESTNSLAAPTTNSRSGDVG